MDCCWNVVVYDGLESVYHADEVKAESVVDLVARVNAMMFADMGEHLPAEGRIEYDLA